MSINEQDCSLHHIPAPLKQQNYKMDGHERNYRFATVICYLVLKNLVYGASQSVYGNESTAEALLTSLKIFSIISTLLKTFPS